ncbi:MAG: phosphate ABC transporter permease PstA [Oscillospiraceae bacterium]|nr:phosphate ABC transporter permease PstA [Oscillospiraceae bacterium]
MIFNNEKHIKKTKFISFVLRSVTYFSAFAVFFVLLSVVVYILVKSAMYVNLDFLNKNILNGKNMLATIINTLYIIILALFFVLPIGIGTAIWLSKYSKKGIFSRVLHFTIEIFSGLPSLVLGLFGYDFFCIKLGMGTSIIAGCLTMVLCTLPTIIKASEEAINSVPLTYEEASFSLGAGRAKTLRSATIPCAVPGIFTGIMLCIGKIAGESAALIYTSGMMCKMPKNFFSHMFSSGRTLTLHLYQTVKQANTDDSVAIAFLYALILLIFVFAINFFTNITLNSIKNK